MRRLLAPASKVWVAALFMIVAGLSAFLVSTSNRVTRVERQVVVLNRTVTRLRLCDQPQECRVLLGELVAAATPGQRRVLAQALGPAGSSRRRRAVTVIGRRVARRHHHALARARHFRPQPAPAHVPAHVSVPPLVPVPIEPPAITPPPVVLNPAGHAPPGQQPDNNPGHGGCPPGQAKKGACS